MRQPNRLANETSPYLLQHAHNPVDWWAWGDDALAEAQRLGKPILLSVGYSACHWCHVMAHESFEHDETAALMNALFVNIKVDREERPDVDQVYMAALHATGQQGGWPLTMFLDSRGRPFWGGTYFPLERRYGQPAFRDVLQSVAAAFRQRPDDIAGNARAILSALETDRAPPDAAPDASVADSIARQFCEHFDPVHGGLAGAPKFPNPTILELLWRAADRTGDESIRARVLTSLEQMALGGIHDQIGGGFARYSVDEQWLVPHFEKMLYDNAQLLPLLALAARHGRNQVLQDAAEQMVAWLVREMITDGGAFAASLDADSLGPSGHPEEGACYVWTPDEIAALLAESAADFCATYDIAAGGNFEGRSIPNRLRSRSRDVNRFGPARALLLAHRSTRPAPARDDKILADWNGLMISGLTRAGDLLDRPDWVACARSAFDAILFHLGGESVLAHSGRGAARIHPGFASDHAFMANAALALFESTGQPAYLDHAKRWCATLLADYRDCATGLIAMTAIGAGGLPIRPMPTQDDAIPNANPATLEALTRLFALTGDVTWRSAADDLAAALAPRALASPFSHTAYFNAVDLINRRADIVLVGAGKSALARIARSVPFTNRTLGHSEALNPGPETATPHALVCAGGVCSLPITSVASFRQRIKGALAQS